MTLQSSTRPKRSCESEAEALWQIRTTWIEDNSQHKRDNSRLLGCDFWPEEENIQTLLETTQHPPLCEPKVKPPTSYHEKDPTCYTNQIIQHIKWSRNIRQFQTCVRESPTRSTPPYRHEIHTETWKQQLETTPTKYIYIYSYVSLIMWAYFRASLSVCAEVNAIQIYNDIMWTISSIWMIYWCKYNPRKISLHRFAILRISRVANLRSFLRACFAKYLSDSLLACDLCVWMKPHNVNLSWFERHWVRSRGCTNIICSKWKALCTKLKLLIRNSRKNRSTWHIGNKGS